MAFRLCYPKKFNDARIEAIHRKGRLTTVLSCEMECRDLIGGRPDYILLHYHHGLIDLLNNSLSNVRYFLHLRQVRPSVVQFTQRRLLCGLMGDVAKAAHVAQMLISLVDNDYSCLNSDGP